MSDDGVYAISGFGVSEPDPFLHRLVDEDRARLDRLAVALERIADRLDALWVNVEQVPK